MAKSQKSNFPKYFLIFTLTIYMIVAITDINTANKSLNHFFQLITKIAPILLVIYVLLVISDLYLNQQKVKQFTQNFRGIKGWGLSIIGGIISSGPVYVWYPFLANLQKKGIEDKYIISFLYNRAIKIPLIPIMLTVFSIPYIIILFVIMIIGSISQGVITQKIIEKWSK